MNLGVEKRQVFPALQPTRYNAKQGINVIHVQMEISLGMGCSFR